MIVRELLVESYRLLPSWVLVVSDPPGHRILPVTHLTSPPPQIASSNVRSFSVTSRRSFTMKCSMKGALREAAIPPMDLATTPVRRIPVIPPHFSRGAKWRITATKFILDSI